MNFLEAVNLMGPDCKLTREKWTGFYLTILPGQNYIWSIGSPSATPVVNAVIYTPSVSDILATDWIVKNN